PELASSRVVPEALTGHGRRLRVEELVERNDGEAGDDVLRRAAGEHPEAAEPALADLPQELEAGASVFHDHCGRTRAESSRDCSLPTSRDGVASASRAPSSESARAAGGSPSSSASDRSNARSRSPARRAASRSSSRLRAASDAAAAASTAARSSAEASLSSTG